MTIEYWYVNVHHTDCKETRKFTTNYIFTFDSVVVGSLMVVATSLGERKIKLQQQSILHANHARGQPTHDRAEEGRGIS